MWCRVRWQMLSSRLYQAMCVLRRFLFYDQWNDSMYFDWIFRCGTKLRGIQALNANFPMRPSVSVVDDIWPWACVDSGYCKLQCWVVYCNTNPYLVRRLSKNGDFCLQYFKLYFMSQCACHLWSDVLNSIYCAGLCRLSFWFLLFHGAQGTCGAFCRHYFRCFRIPVFLYHDDLLTRWTAVILCRRVLWWTLDR